MIRRKRSPSVNIEPIRPANLTAEMWEDYRIFKAEHLLHEWRKKWAAYFPEPH